MCAVHGNQKTISSLKKMAVRPSGVEWPICSLVILLLGTLKKKPPYKPKDGKYYFASLLTGFLLNLLYSTVHSQTMREEGPMSLLLFSRTRLFLVLVLFQP